MSRPLAPLRSGLCPPCGGTKPEERLGERVQDAAVAWRERDRKGTRAAWYADCSRTFALMDRVRVAFRSALVEWRKHALERMLERGISRADVAGVVETGEVIESYPSDTPFPSWLILGWVEARALHVVVAFDDAGGCAFVITVYEPNDLHFASDRKTRNP